MAYKSQLQSITEEVKSRSKNRGRKLLRGLFSMAYSVCSLPQARTTCPVAVPCVVDRILPYQPLIKRMPHRFAYRQSDGGTPHSFQVIVAVSS